MRLQILDRGHGFGTKALFALIRTVSRQPVLDVIKLVKYRADFYGGPMSKVTHEAMRGPSTWSVGDRELMAAFVAKTNQCEFCTKAHTAVARGAYHRDGKRVPDLLLDFEIRLDTGLDTDLDTGLDTGAIEEPLRATLLMIGKLTREHAVDADDMRAVLAAGASRQQIEDALAICFSFNVIGRLADAFGFFVPGPAAFEAGAKYLLARGYR
jgi:alkylhydroperoxidase family enzyme